MALTRDRYLVKKFRVSYKGQKIVYTFDTPRDYHFLSGIAVSIQQTSAIVGSTIGVKVKEKEITDYTHEAKLLCLDTPTLSPNERIHRLDYRMSINVSPIEITYSDGYLYELLQAVTTNPSGGVIPRTTLIAPTYSNPDRTLGDGTTLIGGIGGLGTGIVGTGTIGGGSSSPPPPINFDNPYATIKYPYDVRVYFLIHQK